MRNFPLFPDQASSFAGQVDTLYAVLIGLSLLFGGVLPFIILFLMVRYHRSNKAVDRMNQVHSNLALELTWSGIPLLLVMGVFFWGAFLYVHIRTPPKQTLEVYVIGKQWMWHVQHPNGKRENNELHVPINRPVRLIMTSQDVIHSFYLPSFRVKQDVLPGRYTSMWFEATRPGEYHLFCAEYCGTEHSLMVGRVVALSMADYERWLVTPGEVILPDGSSGVAAAPPVLVPAQGDPMALVGEQLFTSLGCAGCHRMDGAGIGPSLQGLYGSQERMSDGSVITADENYLRTSILNPGAQIVAGYQNVMPSYAGQLGEDQINQLIAYIKSLSDGGTGAMSGGASSGSGTSTSGTSGGATGGGATPSFDAALAAQGKQVFTNLGCAGCHRSDGAGIGPALEKLYNSEVRLADGSVVTADEAYLIESIRNAAAKVVEGYQPVMPVYGNQISDDQVRQLVEYIKSLGD